MNINIPAQNIVLTHLMCVKQRCQPNIYTADETARLLDEKQLGAKTSNPGSNFKPEHQTLTLN